MSVQYNRKRKMQLSMNITEQKKENDVQWYAQCFSYQAYLLFQVSWKKRSRCIGGVMSRGVTRWGQGGTYPRAPNHCGGRCKVPAMSQVVSSIQCICFRKTSGSSMGAPNFLLAPAAF